MVTYIYEKLLKINLVLISIFKIEWQYEDGSLKILQIYIYIKLSLSMLWNDLNQMLKFVNVFLL